MYTSGKKCISILITPSPLHVSHLPPFILKENLQKYYLANVREAKAKVLFWKFMNHYVEYLWD